MYQSKLFTKTRREAPKDEVAKNAELLIRAGYIHKEMAGVYSYLPLGLRVLNNICNIIREEMDAIGGQEVLLTTLQDPAVWEKTGRWDDKVVDNWFKTKLATGTDLGIANTHEEPLTNLLRSHVNSYKDLPLYIYQIQTKFRNELRVKSGIMRAREFLMKDMYSFSRDEKGFNEFYERCALAYAKIFERVGLGNITYRTIAAGGSFTRGFTDEFQTLSKAGEDTIYVDKNKKLAVNKEVFNEETLKKFGLKKDEMTEEKAIEVGNIFPLGTKYSKAIGLTFLDENGTKNDVVMGCYGIGLGRLIGTIVESLSDEKGIIWPKSVAPFNVHLISLGTPEDDVAKFAEKVYKELQNKGISVLFDDRNARAGEKFADSDLIGIPVRAVISDKTFKAGKIEVKERKGGEIKMMTLEELVKEL
ncbi:MAG: aminoacyl--tRNA ligase-related protein [Candidatus Paceibacterota bacterium]